jgi:hypothetical protein
VYARRQTARAHGKSKPRRLTLATIRAAAANPSNIVAGSELPWPVSGRLVLVGSDVTAAEGDADGEGESDGEGDADGKGAGGPAWIVI